MPSPSKNSMSGKTSNKQKSKTPSSKSFEKTIATIQRGYGIEPPQALEIMIDEFDSNDQERDFADTQDFRALVKYLTGWTGTYNGNRDLQKVQHFIVARKKIGSRTIININQYIEKLREKCAATLNELEVLKNAIKKKQQTHPLGELERELFELVERSLECDTVMTLKTLKSKLNK